MLLTYHKGRGGEFLCFCFSQSWYIVLSKTRGRMEFIFHESLELMAFLTCFHLHASAVPRHYCRCETSNRPISYKPFDIQEVA